MTVGPAEKALRDRALYLSKTSPENRVFQALIDEAVSEVRDEALAEAVAVCGAERNFCQKQGAYSSFVEATVIEEKIEALSRRGDR